MRDEVGRNPPSRKEVPQVLATKPMAMVGRDGVEPPESKTTDLQSAPLPLTVYLPTYHIAKDPARLELTTSGSYDTSAL